MPSERYASLEIIGYSYKLFLSRFPLPFRWRFWLYKSYVNKLSQKAFDMYGTQITQTVVSSKSESRKYRNTETELTIIIKDIPRLDKYRGILREKLRIQRRKYKLKV